MNLLSLIALVALYASATPSSVNAATLNDPCAALSASALAQGNESSPVFKPSEVYACLKDVPISRAAAAAQIEWIQNFTQFQSTLAYLKDPTPEYQLAPIDIMGGLSKIGQDAEAGIYSNEFDFEWDIFNLILHADDGHFSLAPFLVQGFVINRTVGLVSVSVDGVEEPKVYLQPDMQAFANSQTNLTISPIKSINGQDANQYLASQGYLAVAQDLDAQYNTFFFNPISITISNAPNFFQSPGQFITYNDSIVYVFDNGTSNTIPITAAAAPDVKFGFQSGQELYNQLLNPATPSPSASSSAAASSSSSSLSSTGAGPNPLTPPGPGFPAPVIKHSGNYVSGYFLNGTDTKNVAVLLISSFDAKTEAIVIEFRQVVQKFLAMCGSANKKNLIIDVRGNAGGFVFLGYDTFKQLFPTQVPYSGVRTRLSPALNALGQIVSNQSTPLGQGVGGYIFDAQSFLQSPDGPFYQSWNQLNGPVEEHDDNFTKIASWEFSNATRNLEFSDNLTMSGYGDRADLPPQVFPSEAITLFTDVTCASTCGIFSNLLIRQGKVQTVVAGGRPNNNAPIAVTGGVQGANVLAYPALEPIVKLALQSQSNSTTITAAQQLRNVAVLSPLLQRAPINLYPSPTSPSVNFLDNIAEGDTSMTPLQFSQPELADCRMYYMPKDTISVEYTWTRVAKGFRTGGKGLCVNGGLQITSNTTTISGTTGTGSPAATMSSTAFTGMAFMRPVSGGLLLTSLVLMFMSILL